MVRIGTLLTSVMVLAACLSTPAGRLWQTSLPNGGAPELPVDLRDQTGLVTGIEPVSLDASQVGNVPSVEADPNDPSAWVVTWLGGCDSDADLVLQSSNRGPRQYLLNVSIGSPGGLGGGCAPIAMGRGIRVHTASPIPVGSITINGAASQST
jgi:hypothetical protein